MGEPLPQQNVAVIGGGPKAVALAAKAYCLQQIGVPVHVSIFEKETIGAAWDGRHGYTDGRQRLCTAAERDLGFPYDDAFDAAVTARMHAEFSWSAFQTAGSGLYSDWVSRGRKPPTHREFAEYLRFAATKSKATVFEGAVTNLRASNGLWTVVQSVTEGSRASVSGFHGVVVTGIGPSARKVPTVVDRRILTGESFWSDLAEIRRLLHTTSRQIVIIGGGGTAAAIASWLVRNSDTNHSISLLNNQATLFTRTSNFFEERIFADDSVWLALSRDDRREFSLRLNRGVVWETVTETLAEAENLTLVPGRATRIGFTPSVPRRMASKGRLTVKYDNSQGGGDLPADIVVDATGFDDWWFLPLLPGKLRAKFRDSKRRLLANRMSADLSFRVRGWPRLHVPTQSQVVGPGFTSLMVLGSMADRILNPYFKAAVR